VSVEGWDETFRDLQRTFLLGAPSAPWRVEVTIEPTFSPHKLDPSKSDTRELGARLEAGFLPLGA